MRRANGLVSAAFFAAIFAAWHSVGTEARAGALYGLIRNGTDSTTLARLDPIGFGVVSGLDIGSDVGGIAISPGIGVTPRGQIVGATGPDSAVQGLIKIDKTTGATTLVGAFNAGGKTMAAIAFGPNGELYGWLGSSDGDLYSIDPATGVATLVGESGLDSPVTGLAIDSNGRIYVSVCCGSSDLRKIDPASGAVSQIVAYDPDDTAILALAFDDADTLLGIRASGGDAGLRDVVTIDPATGEVNILGPSEDYLRSLAFDVFSVAEPATLTILMLGLAGLGFMSRKRGT